MKNLTHKVCSLFSGIGGIDLGFKQAGFEIVWANENKIRENLDNSLMLVTCLSPEIGYEYAAAAAKKAYKENKSLKEAVIELGYMNSSEYDEKVNPEKMV